MNHLNITSHYEVNISNDKSELYEKIVSIKLMVIFLNDFLRFPSTTCLKQGCCFI